MRRRTFCPEDGRPCYTPKEDEPEGFTCANHPLCKSFEARPSPSTVTNEDLVASIMAAIEAAPPTGGLSLTYAQVERGVRAALEARSTVTDDFNPFTRKLSEAELDEVEAAMTGKPKATVTDEELREAISREVFAGIIDPQNSDTVVQSVMIADAILALLDRSRSIRKVGRLEAERDLLAAAEYIDSDGGSLGGDEADRIVTTLRALTSGHTALLRENERSVTCERVVAALNSLLHACNTSPHWTLEMRRGAQASAEVLCLMLGIKLAALNKESKPGEHR